MISYTEPILCIIMYNTWLLFLLVWITCLAKVHYAQCQSLTEGSPATETEFSKWINTTAKANFHTQLTPTSLTWATAWALRVRKLLSQWVATSGWSNVPGWWGEGHSSLEEWVHANTRKSIYMYVISFHIARIAFLTTWNKKNHPSSLDAVV